MIKVSNDFKTAMKQPVKELQAFIEADDQTINDENELISFKVSGEGGLCKSVMRKLEAKYLGEHNLLGKWVSAGFGVKLPSGAYDFLKYGSFLVNELTISKDTGTTSIVAYDKMINAMKPYAKLVTDYPISLYDYTAKLCEACGLELGSELFGYNLWDISKQKDLGNITYDSATGVYSASDNDARDPIIYKLQQYDGATFIEGTNVTRNITATGIYTFTTTRAEKATRIRIANSGISKEFSVYYSIPDNIAVGDTFTVTLEVIDFTVGASKFKNVMLQKGHSVLPYAPYNTMNEWQVTATKDNDGNVVDLWENIDGITYRDIFVQIAQATGSTCVIGADDKVYFKPITNTGEQLTYDNMFKLKLEDQYGEINSVVLSRTPIEGEDVFLKDDASIQTNGLTEFKIENNEIVDKDRGNAIAPIYNVLKGVKYYPFEATTEGLGWYEIGDSFDIVTDTGDVFSTTLFNFAITVDGSLKETLKTTAETKTQTQYQYATTLSKRIKNAEIIVNKQDGQIQSLVSDMYEEDGVVNQKYTQIKQDIDDITFSVQNSGGNNLLKDSVMFEYGSVEKKKETLTWEVSGDGDITIQSDAQSLSYGGLSGQSFTLLNKIAKQKVNVKVSTEGEKTSYTFSTKIKKNATGSCYVKIYNSKESYTVADIPAGTSAFYEDYELKALEPKENYYYVEFYGSADSDATFTDNMLAVGEYKSQWTQANGEVMNTNVNISVDGILVKTVNEDGEYEGDYTVMTPREFAGYSKASGSPKKVFSLNKDVTEVEKLKADAEVTMAPIKIVPITTGDLQGWAFVPST